MAVEEAGFSEGLLWEGIRALPSSQTGLSGAEREGSPKQEVFCNRLAIPLPACDGVTRNLTGPVAQRPIIPIFTRSRPQSPRGSDS
ncbi:hypothetical protein AAFF_G00322730 [Aldrovandia affinis]|uniref:Uncharacterized protein n=1 Tax=Aldrovandia affinis TaxID=143900 RepID=A0AAD7WQ87_9TELE|nr:hypothetical protein AAFF_G00322730 [Aldrovandia affinis]